MTDNITLPRAVALHLREVLLVWSRFALPEDKAAFTALDAALAEQKPQVEGYNTNRDPPTFTITEDKT